MRRAQQLGRYHLLDRIAFGGMAEIYRAKTFDANGQPHLVAVKRVRAGRRNQADDDALIREGRVLGALEHPSIVPVYDLGTMPDGSPYFTMKRVPPMVESLLRQAGYGVTFGSVSGGEPRPTHVPSPAECLVVEGTRVSLHGAQLDLGGIVKGWTVDLAAEMAANAGFAALVNAGGDLRATGTEHGAANGWFVQVDGPTGEPAWEGEVAGALATSTTLKRAWRTSDGGRAHHLIDPRTGLPADSPFVQVSAWAPETWRAECWAKAVLVGGHAAAGAARAAGVPVLAIAPAGAVLVAP